MKRNTLHTRFKTILWDFDGVILDSMAIKAQGFRELFSAYEAADLDRLEAYHYANGGVSRFKKIEYFYRSILHEEISQEHIEKLAKRFGEIVVKKLQDPKNLIQESVSFIRNNTHNYNFHIVSGAEERELKHLCEALGLARYFVSIHGSPTPKVRLIADVIKTNGYRVDQVVLIGDSINDFEAARHNRITFYGYNNEDLKGVCRNYIESFSEFVV